MQMELITVTDGTSLVPRHSAKFHSVPGNEAMMVLASSSLLPALKAVNSATINYNAKQRVRVYVHSFVSIF